MFCWPRVFSFRLSKRGAPSPLSPTDACLGKSEEGAGGGGSRLRRSTEGGQRAAAAVESRDREQFVSQSHGWAAAARAGSRDHLLRPRARPAGPRIHAALLSRGVLSTGRRRRHAERRGEGDQEGNRRALSRYSQNDQREITEGIAVSILIPSNPVARPRPCEVIITRSSSELPRDESRVKVGDGVCGERRVFSC